MVCLVEGAMPVVACWVEGVVEVLMVGVPETLPEAGRHLVMMSPGMASPQGLLEEHWDKEVCSVTEVSSTRQGSSVALVAFLAEEGFWATEGCWEAVACSASSGKAACSAPSRGSPGKDSTCWAPCREGGNLRVVWGEQW